MIYLENSTLKYGSPIRMWVGPQPAVFISDAENMEIVLKSKDCLDKPDFFYKVVRDFLRVDGLFTSNGIFDLYEHLAKENEELKFVNFAFI